MLGVPICEYKDYSHLIHCNDPATVRIHIGLVHGNWGKWYHKSGVTGQWFNYCLVHAELIKASAPGRFDILATESIYNLKKGVTK
jgi:hypothetical protein